MKSINHLAQQLFNKLINSWLFFFSFIFYLSRSWRASPNYIHTAGPNPSPITFQNYLQIIRMSFVNRLFPIGCLSILNSNQIFSSLVSRRMWKSYTHREKLWFITSSTGNQLGYFVKILTADMQISVHHIQSLEIHEEV